MTQQAKSRDIIVREDEFGRLLAEAGLSCGAWAATLLRDRRLLADEDVVAAFVHRAHELEAFLDDFGARENRTFVMLGELAASLHGLATVKTNALHLTARLPRYHVLIDSGPLAAALEQAHVILDDSLTALLEAFANESRRWLRDDLEIALPTGGLSSQRQLLPRNLDEGETVDERQHIAEIGARFLAILATSRSLELGHKRPIRELRDFVAEHATEARCRWYESSVHSIQSMYDTYVLNTAVERDHPWLKSMRGHASVALHLLEMATGLVHFYERHENDIRHERARQAIAKLVAKDEVLDVAVNISLRQAYIYVESAAATASQILRTFVRHGVANLRLLPGITLHARPLALVAQVARHYGTPLEIDFDGDSCAAGSLMSLILLGGKHPRPVEITARGDARALRDLEILFAAGLGEGGRALPPELDYLRARN